MPYSIRSFDSIRQAPLDDWNEVCAACGDSFTDSRFFEVVDDTLSGAIQYALLIVYDDSTGRPVAAASLASSQLDAMTLAGAWPRRVVGAIRRWWPRCMRFTIVTCGLPVTIPQRSLMIAPSADPVEALRAIHAGVARFAAAHRATAVILGDFAAENSWLDVWASLGYSVLDFPPYHIVPVRHASFAEHVDAMRSTYRKQIRRDMRRLSPQVRIEVVSPEEMLSGPITPELYALYLQLLGRASFQLVTLSREFLNEFIRRYSNEIHLVRVFVDDCPAGFSLGIAGGENYCHAMIAVDAELSRRHRLYTNLAYFEFDYAMSHGFTQIELGNEADDFKTRLGSEPQPRRICIRARGALHWPFRLAARFMVPALEPPMPRRVFRRNNSGACPSDNASSASDPRHARSLE